MFSRPKLSIEFLSLLFAFTILSISQSQAQITVDRTIVTWSRDMPPVLNVAVRNASDESMLVSVEPVQAMNPGEKEENITVNTELLAAPKRLSVPAKGERTVRLLYRGQRTDLEKVFRVSFKPIASDEDPDKDQKPKGTKNVALKVLSGVGILIFIEPLDAKPNLTWDKNNQSITLRNSGNINILVDNINSCDASGSNCQSPKPKRLYPGKEYSIPAVPDGKVTLRQRIRGEVSEVEIN